MLLQSCSNSDNILITAIIPSTVNSAFITDTVQLKMGVFFLFTALITNIHFVLSIVQFFPSSDCDYCITPSCRGTVMAAGDFNVTHNRLLIEQAIRSWGSSGDVLIQVLTSCSDQQRVLLAKDYIRTGRTLMDDITSDMRGKFPNILLALTKPLPLFYAEELHFALLTKNYKTIIEIMTSMPGCAIRELSLVYQFRYGVSLQADISSRTWFKFRTLMLLLAKGEREDHDKVDNEIAKQDANLLINSGPLAWRAKTKPFEEILSKRSYPQLKATFDLYDTLRKEKDPSFKSILNDVNNLFSDKIRDTFLTIIRNALSQPRYFASELESALSGFPKLDNSRKVIRIIRGRCELDLQDIKEEYAAVYQKSLDNQVKAKTNKHFQKQLVTILT